MRHVHTFHPHFKLVYEKTIVLFISFFQLLFVLWLWKQCEIAVMMRYELWYNVINEDILHDNLCNVWLISHNHFYRMIKGFNIQMFLSILNAYYQTWCQPFDCKWNKNSTICAIVRICFAQYWKKMFLFDSSLFFSYNFIRWYCDRMMFSYKRLSSTQPTHAHNTQTEWNLISEYLHCHVYWIMLMKFDANV